MRTRKSFRAWSLSVVALTAGALAIAAPAWASSPSSGTVGPAKSSAGWKGRSFVAGATASPAACGAGGDALCDHFSLSVPASPSYWSTHSGGVRVSIGWAASGDNFDLYVYRAGGLVGSSTSGSSTTESVAVANPSGTYSVVVVPKLVTNSGYRGHVSFSSLANPAPPSPTGSGGGGSGGSGGGGGGTGGSGGGGGTTTGGGGGHSGGGGGSSGGSSGGFPTVLRPGANPNFGSLSGPLFGYGGPYHFKPPFSVGDSPGHAVMPPQNGPVTGGSSGGLAGLFTGGGHVVQPGQQGGSSGSSGQGPGSGGPVRIRTAGNGDHHRGGMPNLIWLLVPLGLILAAAVWFVIVESDGRATVAGRAAPATAGKDRSSVDVDRAPPVGPFVMIGFAVRRLFRGRRGH
ncbi:MAG: hypothetical protein ACJ77A_00610 [Actinomycetota bacterium]